MRAPTLCADDLASPRAQRKTLHKAYSGGAALSVSKFPDLMRRTPALGAEAGHAARAHKSTRGTANSEDISLPANVRDITQNRD
jgi:hypothetical protein